MILYSIKTTVKHDNLEELPHIIEGYRIKVYMTGAREGLEIKEIEMIYDIAIANFCSFKVHRDSVEFFLEKDWKQVFPDLLTRKRDRILFKHSLDRIIHAIITYRSWKEYYRFQSGELGS